MKLQSNKIKRNSPCPCGSGKKVKHCCLADIQGFQDRVNGGANPAHLVVERILAGEPSEPESQPDP